MPPGRSRVRQNAGEAATRVLANAATRGFPHARRSNWVQSTEPGRLSQERKCAGRSIQSSHPERRLPVSARLNVLTGGTGLLGSHIAEQLAARGEHLRAIVRPTSDTTFLKSLGAELVEASLADADSLRRAVAGADVLYHCAAHVGDWGAWKQ